MDTGLDKWIDSLGSQTPEQWAISALENATVKKTKFRFLVPHIAKAISEAIKQAKARK